MQQTLPLTPAPSSTQSSIPIASPRMTHIHPNRPRVLVVPTIMGPQQQQPSTKEIRCRGTTTFEQAKAFGGHGGNYIFQWPPGVGNPFFIVACSQCRSSASSRGFFWKHPFEGIRAGLQHFGMHMSEWQILEHSGWHGKCGNLPPRLYENRQLTCDFLNLQ